MKLLSRELPNCKHGSKVIAVDLPKDGISDRSKVINGKTTNFTVGGPSSSDLVHYPLSVSKPKKGYIAGPDMAFRVPSLAPDSNNVVAWNCFSFPDTPSTEPIAHLPSGSESLRGGKTILTVRGKDRTGFLAMDVCREERFHLSAPLQLRPGGDNRT